MSTDNSSELVSCPFCRCRTVLRSSDLPMVDDGSVHCDGCRASAPSDDAWNTRTTTEESSIVQAVPEGFAQLPIQVALEMGAATSLLTIALETLDQIGTLKKRGRASVHARSTAIFIRTQLEAAQCKGDV